jgi:myosin-light-chain kinase
MGCSSAKTPVEPASDVANKPKEKDKDAPQANQEDIRDKYELGAVLGSGSFGQVREAKLKDGEGIRAVKMIEPDKGDGEWSNQAIFVREVALLQQLNHENIIRFYDFYEDIHFLYVVMELCKGGEVFVKIVEMKRFSEKNAAHLGKQMLQAMDYVHKLNIAHRDIKAENFMLSEPNVNSAVKMIDFGMACKFKPDQVLTELCGSPHYLSPELIGQKYNHLADVWAFGVLLYLLMYGHYPYDAKHPRDIMVKILTEPIRWQSKAKLSKDAIDLLGKLLEHNIKKRLTAEQALKHDWIVRTVVAAPGSEGDQVIDTEVVRSAHRRVTETKKTVAEEIEKLRNQKLQAIEEDFSKGVRHGHRLGETPNEEYMTKPEFVRRENKITTAPSSDLKTTTRRNSFAKFMNKFTGGEKMGAEPGILEEEAEDTIKEEPEGGEDVEIMPAPKVSPRAKQPLRKGRSASMQVTPNPRRLSYLGGITKDDENNFVRLYEEKKTGAEFTALVPGAPANLAEFPSEGTNGSETCVP